MEQAVAAFRARVDHAAQRNVKALLEVLPGFKYFKAFGEDLPWFYAGGSDRVTADEVLSAYL